MESNLGLPGNPRYQPKQMVDVFGYDNLVKAVAEVEIATLLTLFDMGIIPTHLRGVLNENRDRLLAITTTQVDEQEKITKHDIRAWVQLAQQILGPELGKWLHIPLTSYDVIDTARALQYKQAYRDALCPSLNELISGLADKAEELAEVLQVGRTHGQHALPITAGFWLATVLHRIVYNRQEMHRQALAIRGKISGAVGVHNAQVALGLDRIQGFQSFEVEVLKRLNLKPALISTQIAPPEPLAYFLHSCLLQSSVLAQLGRDCRHLMRSEINELSEPFSENQVGSSTMAHKRNPITFENMEGTAIRSRGEYSKILETLVSEHQRDLVGSSVARDFPIILINLQHQLNSLLRKNEEGLTFLERIKVDRAACYDNFTISSDVILAEPLYVALQMAGYEGDAHHLVNHTLVPGALRSKMPLGSYTEGLTNYSATDPKLKEAWDNIPEGMKMMLDFPRDYIGSAVDTTMKIVHLARADVKQHSF